MTIPHITPEQFTAFDASSSPFLRELVNRRIDVFNKAQELAEANAQQPLISADEARKLGAGAEYYRSGEGDWVSCRWLEKFYTHFSWGEVIKYRTIKQAQTEPVNPTAWDIEESVLAIYRIFKSAASFSTKDAALQSELKSVFQAGTQLTQPVTIDPHATLRAEYAKQVAEGTTGFYLWEFICVGEFVSYIECIETPKFANGFKYQCTDISCMVSKDGEPAIRMLRTEAQALQRQTKDTHDWFDPEGNDWKYWAFGGEGTYKYRAKPAKVVKWSSLPVGVMTNKGELRFAHADGQCQIGFSRDEDGQDLWWYKPKELRLAPADAQPWIAFQGGNAERNAALVVMNTGGILIRVDGTRYKITGLAEGYEMEGSK